MASVPRTYTDLKETIRSYLGIQASSPHAQDIDLLIGMAEDRLSAELRTRRQITTAYLTIDENGEADLPDGYAGLARIVVARNSRIPVVEVSGTWLDDEFPYVGSGDTAYFAIEGQKVRFRPVPTGTGEGLVVQVVEDDGDELVEEDGDTLWINGLAPVVGITYYAEIPPLSEDNQINWLLRLMPAVYIFTALEEAALLYPDDENAARYGGTAQVWIDRVNRRDRSERGRSRRLSVAGPTP
jgi:hypothetical protein